MSFLDWPIFLPVWVVALLTILLMVTIAYIIWAFYQEIKWNPEGKLFRKARKSGFPILRIHAHNGFFKFLLGEKEKKGDIIFKFDKKSNEGIRIDTRIQSGSVPKSFTQGGLEMYDYSTSNPYTLSARNATAMQNILGYVRKEYPILQVFDGQTVLEYISRSRSDLPHDCRNLVEMAEIDIPVPEEALNEFKETIVDEIEKLAELEGKNLTEVDKEDAISRLYEERVKSFMNEYRANYLVKVFMKIQDEVTELPLPPGKFFSFAEAFQLISTAFTAFDFQTMKQLFEMIAQKEHDIDLKWIVGIALACAILFVGAGLGYTFIKAGKG